MSTVKQLVYFLFMATLMTGPAIGLGAVDRGGSQWGPLDAIEEALSDFEQVLTAPILGLEATLAESTHALNQTAHSFDHSLDHDEERDFVVQAQNIQDLLAQREAVISWNTRSLETASSTLDWIATWVELFNAPAPEHDFQHPNRVFTLLDRIQTMKDSLTYISSMTPDPFEMLERHEQITRILAAVQEMIGQQVARGR